jgi:ribosomal protein L37AE/L43A
MTTLTARPKCPVCGSRESRYRSGDNSFTCRRCGHVWPKEVTT